jgi:hypothetical protein
LRLSISITNSFEIIVIHITYLQIKDDDDIETTGPATSIYIPTGAYDSFISTESQQAKQMYQREGTFSYSSRTSGYSSYDTDYSDASYRTARCDSATAINMKTGSSLFSLEIPQMGKGAIKKPLNGQSKTAKKSKGAKKTGKDKKGKKTSNASCPDLVEFENEFETMHLCQDHKEVDETGSSSEEEDTDMYLHDVLVYQERAAHTKGVFRFEKVAYPDLVGARGCPYLEPLYRRKFGVQR